MAYNYIKGKINSGDDNLHQKGEGKIVKMTLNGVEVKKIFWNLQGHHKVKLICRKED